ncbi:peptidase, M23/M37 family [alpha proteobacterium U9-1i]|nr:peptidase, M23/M37 family [alpha proteobacterium U9-1i]
MIAIFTLQLGMVAGALLWLALTKAPNRIWAIVITGACALVCVGAAAVGIWIYPPLWLFGALATGVLAAIALRAWRRAGSAHAHEPAQTLLRWLGAPVWFIVGGALIWQGIIGRAPPSTDFVNLAPPLRGGGYCAISGGASPLLNFHMETLAAGKEAYRGQSYGVDFIAVSRLGFRTHPAYMLQPAPRAVSAYRIFGAEVFSPCNGEVIVAHDGMADQPAGEPNLSLMAGNHVVVRCDGHDVLLAHLRHGSVAVSAGQRIEMGVRLGEVGNTGATDEPHLHVSVQRAVNPQPDFSGEPVHVMFSGRFLARGACLPD